MNDFINFYKKNNINAAIIATVVSRLIGDLLYSFIDNILFPIIKIDINSDGKPDINSYINNHLNIFGMKFKFIKFLIELIKFFILLYIIYIITSKI